MRERVIQLSQQNGKGRNEIAYELNLSQGSVSNILKEWRGQPNTNIINADTNSNNTLPISDIDFSDIPYQENYPGLVDSETEDLGVKKDFLLKQIEESQKILEANKKAADALLAVKEEVAKCGIEDGSIEFIKVIQLFRKYGYDPSKIMNAFLEVQNVTAEKRNLEQLKEDTEHKLRVLRKKLEEIALGDFETLRKVIVSLLTLETYGIGIEQIISYYHNQRAYTSYRGEVST
jgi:hypothetical protein